MLLLHYFAHLGWTFEMGNQLTNNLQFLKKKHLRYFFVNLKVMG